MLGVPFIHGALCSFIVKPDIPTHDSLCSCFAILGVPIHDTVCSLSANLEPPPHCRPRMNVSIQHVDAAPHLSYLAKATSLCYGT